jgi:hypothetical protein
MDITKERAAEEQRVDAQRELEKAMAQVISEFLRICAHCKTMRDSTGNWTSIENYISDKSQVLFSHGYCPECATNILSAVRGR